MNEAIEFVRKWNNKTPQENFDNYIKTQMKYAYEDGEDEGIRKTKLEVAKKLISLNYKIKDIANATGLSINDIKEIKREMK